jgi:hypothetical protein
MHDASSTQGRAVRRLGPITATLLVASLCAGAAAQLAAAEPTAVASVWVPKNVQFVYGGFTTKYTCDGLQTKMRRILLELGARDDLKVISFGCLQGNAPVTNAGVRIAMHVLQPVSAAGGESLPAHWKNVDLLADRDPIDASRDCELIAQLKQDVLPWFAPRQIDYSAQCSAYQPLSGGTRLKAEVLVPETAASVAAAH